MGQSCSPLGRRSRAQMDCSSGRSCAYGSPSAYAACRRTSTNIMCHTFAGFRFAAFHRHGVEGAQVHRREHGRRERALDGQSVDGFSGIRKQLRGRPRPTHHREEIRAIEKRASPNGEGGSNRADPSSLRNFEQARRHLVEAYAGADDQEAVIVHHLVFEGEMLVAGEQLDTRPHALPDPYGPGIAAT